LFYALVSIRHAIEWNVVDLFRIPSVFSLWLEDVGVSPGAVLQRAALQPGLFSQDKAWVDTHQFFAVWEAITDLSADPAIGLRIGTLKRIERYDPVLISALSARSFRDAMEKLARYKRLVCPEDLRLVERAGEYSIQVVFTLAEREEPAALIDAIFAMVHTLGQRGAGTALRPLRIELARDPIAATAYRAQFKCDIRFRARRNALVYDARQIDTPFATHNPDLLGLIDPRLEEALSTRRGRNNLSEQVRQAQRRLLAGRRPTLRDVAAELNLSSRTLQRRLGEAGASFQQLLAETRRRMALHYLRESPLELAEVSYLLGFEDSNSFHRAFQTWEGTSPGRWRALNGKAHGIPR